MKRILVLGSLNIDLVQRIDCVPVAGQTLKGGDLQTFAGGKGANQACAAARLGAEVRMAGKLGSDVFAERIRRELQAAGVDIALVGRSVASTGSATIFVLPSGDNMIVLSSGANADVSPGFALHAIDDLQPGDLLLCQLEIPLETVEAALRSAHKRGIVTMLDPAPACRLPDSLLASVSILTPNQTEAATLTGSSEAPATMFDAERYAAELRRKGAEIVIITMGEQGCLINDANGAAVIPGLAVRACDTTAAGDTFNGALAAALARGSSLSEAANFANAAAAISVTRPGALCSIPSASEVDEFLASQKVNI